MGSANMPLSHAGQKNPGSATPRCPRSADRLEGLGRRKPSASNVPEVGLGSEPSILPLSPVCTCPLLHGLIPEPRVCRRQQGSLWTVVQVGSCTELRDKQS